MLEYGLRIQSAKAHVFELSLVIPAPEQTQRVSLPVWIPGSYLVREFSKHLSGLQAWQDGRARKIRQLDKCSWEIACDSNAGALELNWQVYAFDTSVRTAFLDQRRGFLNGTSAFLRVHGREDETVRLSVAKPHEPELHDWSVACALPCTKGDSQGFGTYKAANYDELVDSPIELGTFWRGRFRAAGVVHEFVVAGAPATFDGKRLLADTQRICEAEIAFWHGKNGKPPFKRYVFMLNAMSDAYGGLEHRASTALVCQRGDLPRKGEPAGEKLRSGYQTLLGLISHEYFHAWNVKRLRPAAFERYDYTQENYTELLWFFEGFTSYYDDLMLRRADLVDDQQYLALLAKNINAVQAMPGRLKQTVAQASFDAWIKYYRVDENTPNATVSYYTKGALVALCLDLTLRAQGKGSLDDVMRLLWQKHGGPVSEADIASAFKSISGRSYARELRAWVHSTADLPAEKLLRSAGVEMKHATATVEQQLGLKVAESASGVVVKTVLNESAAQRAGIAAGDELIAVNGWRLKTLKDWCLYVPTETSAELTLARDAMLLTVTLEMAHSPVARTARLTRLPEAKLKQQAVALRNWPRK